MSRQIQDKLSSISGADLLRAPSLSVRAAEPMMRSQNSALSPSPSPSLRTGGGGGGEGVGEIALTHARWIRAAAVKETILTPHLLRRQRKQTALRGNRNPTLCCGANIRTVTVLIIERGARRPAPGKMMHLKISLSLWKPRSGLCASMS